MKAKRRCKLSIGGSAAGWIYFVNKIYFTQQALGSCQLTNAPIFKGSKLADIHSLKGFLESQDQGEEKNTSRESFLGAATPKKGKLSMALFYASYDEN